MSLLDVIRSMFGLSNHHDGAFSYRDSDPHLEPDSDDLNGYKKSQFQTKEFSYIHYEMADEFGYKTSQPVLIDYHGLLRDCGADSVYLHYGFDNWENRTIHTMQMNQQTNGSFYLTVQPEQHREVNYCFKDSADHWDNNNGWNWSNKID